MGGGGGWGVVIDPSLILTASTKNDSCHDTKNDLCEKTSGCLPFVYLLRR